MRYITIVFAFCILGIWLFNVKTLREVTSLEKELKIANENLEELFMNVVKNGKRL